MGWDEFRESRELLSVLVTNALKGEESQQIIRKKCSLTSSIPFHSLVLFYRNVPQQEENHTSTPCAVHHIADPTIQAQTVTEPR